MRQVDGLTGAAHDVAASGNLAHDHARVRVDVGAESASEAQFGERHVGTEDALLPEAEVATGESGPETEGVLDRIGCGIPVVGLELDSS